MVRKVIIAILIVVVAGTGIWYYLSRVHHAQIEKIQQNPREYEGKVVTIEGEVTDRTSFFGVIKFFRVRDKTGEIIVVTKRFLPEAHSKVRVKGRIDEVFSVGDQKLLVFVEESVEKEGGTKSP
jgi:aspartyl/asparaginyl-tRNA synthetase